MKAGLPCSRCGRPAKLRALYLRRNGVAHLVGRYGGACFYKVAFDLRVADGQLEHENTRPIYLRGLT